jgi:hypothetical protein
VLRTRMIGGAIVDHDRYHLKEFSELRNKFSIGSDTEQQTLGNLLRRSELTYASSKEIDHSPLLALPLQIRLANSTSANVGRTLMDLELELRRTASYMSSGTIRPSRNNEIVEVISARHVSSIDLVIAAAMEIHSSLTSRPLDFLQILNWFWTHRHNFTKVRLPHDNTDPTRIWTEMIEMAKRCIESGRSVVVTAAVEIDGSTKFGFKSL